MHVDTFDVGTCLVIPVQKVPRHEDGIATRDLKHQRHDRPNGPNML